jgi:sulfatase maturation enzyme AslB (radical SAM superfamily)
MITARSVIIINTIVLFAMKNRRERKPSYIEVGVGPTCLKDCAFCLEGGRGSKREVVNLSDFKKILKRNRPEKVVLSGGEPLLNKELLSYIDLAKEFNVSTISLVSSWESGFGAKFIKKLLDSGVNEVMLSIEGPSEIHDILTRRDGSYKNIAEAFRYFYAYKRKYDFRLIIHSNINKINVSILPIFVSRFLKKFPRIDCYHLQTLEPLGSALLAKEKILPRYSEVVEFFSPYLDSFIENHSNIVRFGLLPYCMIQKKYFPLLGLRADVLLPQRNGEMVKSYSSEGKIKLKSCLECKMSNICDGIWENYLKIYDKEEFIPIK